MRRFATAVLVACLVSWRADAVPITSIWTVYRDGDTRLARTRASEYGPVRRSRAVSGDTDARCDGVCRVVVCDCEPPVPYVDRLSICTATSPASCRPVIVDVPVGTSQQYEHGLSSVHVECAPGRPKDCRTRR